MHRSVAFCLLADGAVSSLGVDKLTGVRPR
jgi:hypothetical protein